MVVQRPQEGVAVRALEERVLDLHLPAAQLFAACKPLRQLQDALPLVHLLLDGIEALPSGFGGRSQPGLLQERERYRISTPGCPLCGRSACSAAARGSGGRRRSARRGDGCQPGAAPPSPQRGSSIGRSRGPTAPTPAAPRSPCRFPAALGTAIRSARPPPPPRTVCRTPPEQSTAAWTYTWSREQHNRRQLSGAGQEGPRRAVPCRAPPAGTHRSMEAEVSSCCCRRLFSCLSPSVSSSSSSTSSLHTLLLTLRRTKRRSARGRAAPAPPLRGPRSPPHGRAAPRRLRPPGTPTPSSTRGNGGGPGRLQRPLAEGRTKCHYALGAISASSLKAAQRRVSHLRSTFAPRFLLPPQRNTPRITGRRTLFPLAQLLFLIRHKSRIQVLWEHSKVQTQQPKEKPKTPKENELHFQKQRRT